MVEKYGKINALVNNAGINLPRLLVDAAGERPEHCFDALYRDYPLDEEIIDLVQETFARSPVGRTTRQRFERFLTVMLDRFLTGHPIGELSTAFYRLAARPEFEAVNTLMDQIAAFLHTDIPSEERLFVLLPIVGMRTPADVMDMRSIQLDPAKRPLQAKIFRQIRLEMDLQVASPEFEEEFLYHLMFMVNRLRFHVKLKSPMVDELREKYPLAWRMAGVAARVIQSEQGVEVTEDEHSYLASYFSVFLEERAKHRRPFQAAVVCGTGRVTARLVAAQLRRVLDSASELTLLSCDKVTPELLAGFDLVFTTVEVACGRKSGGFHAGAIVMFLIDEDGVIREGKKLMGVTCFARVTSLPGFEGKYVGGLTEEDLPKYGKNLRKAILDASNTYNKFMAGEVIPEPPSPFQRAGRTLAGAIRT